MTKIKADINELPKFRYIEDVTRYLTDFAKDFKETQQIIKQHQSLLANVLKTVKLTAGENFSITDGDEGLTKSLIRKSKVKVDPELTKVIVPAIGKLKTQYALAEDLYNRYRILESLTTQIAMQFPDRRGAAYDKAESGLKELKDKVGAALKEVLEFLNLVAKKHVPQSFQKYMSAVQDLISEEVIFKDSELFLYVSVDDDGSLVFSYYLMLIDAINDNAEIHPHLYISVQWVVGGNVFVQLNNEFEVPNVLLTQGGTEVSTAGTAVKAISDLLLLENFSTALGDIPLLMQLKVDPSKVNLDLFSYREFVTKLEVDSAAFIFTLKKAALDPKILNEVKMQLYKELKVLTKNNGTKIKLSETGNKLKYTLYRVAKGGEVNTFDCEWLQDKFGITDQQLKKVVNILNSDVPVKKEPEAAKSEFNEGWTLQRRLKGE